MNIKDIFIFIGPPGSGKGSLSQMCTQKLGWLKLSTGSLCRKHITQGTQIGKQIDFAIKSGKLVSDDLISQMVQEWFNDSSGACAVILDGFPRTLAQAQAFQELLHKDGQYRLNVVQFMISDEGIIKRLSGRMICGNIDCQAVFSIVSGSSLRPKKPMICDICTNYLIKRKDDSKEAVHERLKIYHVHERDLIDFYKKSGRKIHKLVVEKPLAQIFEDFKNIMREK